MIHFKSLLYLSHFATGFFLCTKIKMFQNSQMCAFWQYYDDDYDFSDFIYFTTELQINPVAENALRYSNQSDFLLHLIAKSLAIRKCFGTWTETNCCWLCWHTLITIPKSHLSLPPIRMYLFKIQWFAPLLNQILSCFPAWRRQRRQQRARQPRRCRPPSSWTSSWEKSRVTTPGSGQISKVGGATKTHLDKIGM